MRILTNMAFWQSELWRQTTDSLYDLSPLRDPPHMPWWREAIALWRMNPRYDIVVTMGIRESMAYGALCWVTGRSPKQIMCEVFIDDPKPRSPLWRLKNGAYRAIARRAWGLLTNSTAEMQTNAERFDLPLDRFRYVPLNTNIAEPRRVREHRGYMLVAGRTLRDLATLRAVVDADPGPFVLVTGRGATPTRQWPPHVTVYEEIPRARYLELLRDAWLVLLPLKPSPRATGQVVFLEAMALGKPVIVTRGTGSADYVRDGENGCLVPPEDPGAILRAIQRLRTDPAAYDRLADQAVLDILREHTFTVHAERKLEAIRALAARPSAG